LVRPIDYRCDIQTHPPRFQFESTSANERWTISQPNYDGGRVTPLYPTKL
jgi:hypothetical protein